MASQEIHSFVEKFHQLWKAGLSAHLDIDTHAGEAWVGLRVKLGHDREHHREGEHPASFYPKEENSSRQRRRIRRAAARLVQEKESKWESPEVKVVSEKGTNNVEVENTDEKKSKANKSSTDDEISEIAVDEKAETSAVEEVSDEIEEKVEDAAAEAVETHDKTILINDVDDADVGNVVTATVASEEPYKNNDVNDNLDVKTITTETKELSTEKEWIPARPSVETVFVTAVISHSSSSQVTDSDINYLLRIIRSKEHLNQNIISVDLGSVQSFKENSSKFEHKVQLMVHVKTINLWENSRSYIYHHSGKDIWTLRDGTEVSLRRIHQKT